MHTFKKYFLLFVILILPVAANAVENIDSVLKYAWGDKLGWINFNPEGGGVTVSNTLLSGYAWSANYGWINLSPSNAGVVNDGHGNLSGSAWSENLGWINFSGVTISNGLFSGQATGSESGTINFSCDHCAVKTNWQEATASNRSSVAVVPVYPQSASIDIPVAYNQLIVSSSNAEINIPLSGGSDVKGVSFSLTSDFDNASIFPFQNNLAINICPLGNCPTGNYEVWLKFFSSTGHSSAPQKIIVAYQSVADKKCDDDRENFLKKEKERFGAVNLALSRRLSGLILLQTEDLGRAWYVYPKNLQRYYLGCPQDAFKVMRKLSLGISNKNFTSLSSKDKKRLSGMILLKVEDSGKAYFISPIDLKLYYLGRPDDARRIMRELALGVTNKTLSQIKIGE
ncbi:MAG: hypothetical protein PHR00_03815 [Patescibacteria group bacterium]|nr:hypothetical protein [Patescibacteria group bacterium]